MTTRSGTLEDATRRTTLLKLRDPDGRKGGDGGRAATTTAPGLDDGGLPNDETAIAEDVLGAREDGSQG